MESTKPSAPRMRFGTAPRDVASNLYISAEHDKASVAGKHSPGPGNYATPSGLGAQQVGQAANGIACASHRVLSHVMQHMLGAGSG